MRSSIASYGVMTAIGLATSTFSIGARAETLRLLPRTQVSPPGPVGSTASVGDIEASVVGKDGVHVVVSWVHVPSTSHVSVGNVVQATAMALDGTTTAIVDAGVDYPAVLALTADATGPIQIIGAPVSDDPAATWHVFAARPGTTASTMIVPTPAQPIGFDQAVSIREISVPRRLRGSASAENLPIGLVTASQGILSLMPFGVGLDPALVPSGGSSGGPRAMGDAIGTARAAYWVDGTGAILEQFATGRLPVDTNGNMREAAETISRPTTRPAFTNAQSGTLRAVVPQGSGRLDCRTYPSSGPAVVDCGMPATAIEDLDAVADEQYPGDIWFTGSTGGAVDGSYIFIGESRLPGTLTRLDTNGVSNCFHPRVAAMLGESLSVPQHAIVVASCFPNTGDPAPRVFAWVVERAAIGTDAGTDASDDATADATTTDDGVPNDAGVDGSTSIDVNIDSVSFRGSGCTCRTTPARGADSHWRAIVIAASVVALGSSSRRRSRQL